MKKPLVKILQSQGYGSRKECTWIIKGSGVEIGGELHKNPDRKFDIADLEFTIAGQQHRYRERVYIMLYKPIGYECSHRPQHHESALDLMPDHFINRKIQIAGRLDVDTDGLLLLSDDGQFIHHVTSPKKGVSKTYLVGLKHSFTPDQEKKLLSGVELHQEPELFRALAVNQIDEHSISMSIGQGCYHQVKRMIAAASNRVETLRRTAVGDLFLPEDLEPGDWMYLEADQLEALGYCAA